MMYEDNNYLAHHGVKGMKWGVRRYQNKDGSLTDKGIKKYAKKGYAKDSFDSNKTVGGKVWDAYTGAHKTAASVKYDISSKKQNKERAEKYLAEKNANKEINKKKAAETAAKGAKKTAKVLGNIGLMYVSDQVFNNGLGTKIVKSTIKYTGRAVVSSYIKARGGWDIRWYDN